MGGPQQSEFKNYEISKYKEREVYKQNLLSEEEFQNKYSLTQDAQKNSESMGNMLRQGMYARYGEAKPEYKKIKKWALDQTTSVYKNKELSHFAKKDVADHAEKQIDLQRHLYVEQGLFQERKEDELNYLKKSVRKNEAELLDQRFQTEEEKEALSNWFVGQKKDEKTGKMEQVNYFDNLANNTTKSYYFGLKQVIKDLPQMIKAGDFTFKNDKEFVSKFAEKYDLLCKGACADVFIRKLEEHIDNGDTGRDVSLTEAKAVVELCKQLKEEYEERRDLIQSPYYAMLTAKDLDRYLGQDWEDRVKEDFKEGNDKIVEYITRYRKLKNSATGKGTDINALYHEKLTRFQNERKDTDVKKAQELQIEEKETPEATMEAYYEKKRNEAINTWLEKGTDEFIRETNFYSVPSYNYIPWTTFREFEMMLLEIKSTKTLNGAPVKPEDYDYIVRELDAIMVFRKDAQAQDFATTHANDIYHGDIADLKNPAFLKTEEGKLLKKLYDSKWKSKEGDNKQAFDAYMGRLFYLMIQISDKGYIVSPKYEKRLEDQKAVEDVVESKRQIYQEEYYKKQGVNNPGEQEKINFPEFTVNGKLYSTYAKDDSVISVLVGKDLKLNLEAAKLMDELCKHIKDAFVVHSLYGREDGMKRFVKVAYSNRYIREIEAVEAKLIPLLFDEIPEVREYLRNHQELKSKTEFAALYQKLEEAG